MSLKTCRERHVAEDTSERPGEARDFARRPRSTGLAALITIGRLQGRDAILDELWAIALMDDVVTEDEAVLLKTAEEQLTRFEELLRDVYRDDVVDFDEFLRLRRARKEILEYTLHKALADGRITHDERQLLIRIIELLPLVR